MRGPGLSLGAGDAHAASPEGEPREHHRPQVVTLALEPVTRPNHLFRGLSSGVGLYGGFALEFQAGLLEFVIGV